MDDNGLLYNLYTQVGGNDYKIPFIVLGCADMVCVFLNLALLPSIGRKQLIYCLDFLIICLFRCCWFLL